MRREFKNQGFLHKYNVDGSIDSICSGCFMRLKSSLDKSVLRKAERSHECVEFSLERLLYPPDPHGRDDISPASTLETHHPARTGQP